MLLQQNNSTEGAKEQIILEAAMDEFIAKGWSGARMQAIADRAGMSKTLLHYYFRSKEKLYEKTLHSVMNYFFGIVLGEIKNAETFKELLKSIIDSIISGTAKNPRVPLFLMQELSRGGKSAKTILGKVLKKQDLPITTIMLNRVQEAVQKGEIRPVQPIHFMLTLIGSCLYFSMAEPIVMEIAHLTESLPNFNRDAFVEERKKEIFNLLYYGLQTGETENDKI